MDKKLYAPRELGAAYRIMQRESYSELVASVAGVMAAPPQSKETFTTLAELLGLSEVEQLCLTWWMKDRKRALLEVARGRTPEMRQVPMPVFYSKKQGTGKSFIVDKICEIFGELSEVKNISEIEDQFNYMQWGKLFVANFDEMAGLDSTDMNLLKQWVFQKKFTKRKMQSELQNHIYRIVAGIGSSNEPVGEIVWDSSGTRRFCQIDVITDGRYIKAAKTLDFTSIWQSIDHKSTLSEAERKIISDEQEKQRRKDKIEVWYEDKGYDCLVGGGKVGGLVLYTNFTGWCHANGEKPLTNTAFGNRIKSFYKGVIERSRSNGTHYELIKTSD